MPVLLVAVIEDRSKIWDVLDAWESLGINGATVFDSAGLHRLQGLRGDLPLFPSVHDLLGRTEANHRTIWTVLENEADVEALVHATEAIVGPLDQPRAGLMFTVPVLKVWGMRPPKTDD